MDAIRAFWAKSLINKLALVTVVGLFCCCGLTLIGRGGRAGTPAAAPAQQETAPAESTQAAPAATPVPDATSLPSATPEPSATPAPTALPVAPVELSGSGQTVTDPVALPSQASRAVFSHQGSRNFIVYAYDAAGDRDLLVNTIGAYAGTRPVFGSGEVFFEIDADGPWTIRLEVIPADDAAAGGISGEGDYVSGLFMPTSSGPTPFEVSHVGERNFIVRLHCASGSDLVQNELGAVSGSTVVRYGDGPCVWEVQADGTWSLMPR